jgi:holo-[acyl-carrier protein] synthase
LSTHKIIGVGTDLVDVRRIQNVITKYPLVFEQRVFTDSECTHARQQASPSLSYAKRFAAKEAVSKALGIGIGKILSWKDIEITNDFLGRPIVTLSEKSRNALSQVLGAFDIWISLSDEFPYAQAMAVCAAIE